MIFLSRYQRLRCLDRPERTAGPVPIRDLLLLSFSWTLVMAVGLMPLADAASGSKPSIVTPTAVSFAITIGSAIVLRRRYSWVGLILHIYGQIAIWLSIFAISLTLVLLLAERT